MIRCQFRRFTSAAISVVAALYGRVLCVDCGTVRGPWPCETVSGREAAGKSALGNSRLRPDQPPQHTRRPGP